MGLVITLAYYNILRVIRIGRMAAIITVIPIVMAMPFVAAPRVDYTLWLARACPALCAFFLTIIFYGQSTADKASGLDMTFRAAQVSAFEITASRVVSAVAILAAQTTILIAICAIR